MDTKWKKFKTSKINRLLCGAMAVLLIISFVYNFLPCFFYLDYIGLEKSVLSSKDELDLSDHYYFASAVSSDVDNILTYINKRDYDSSYILEKERVLDIAVDNFISEKLQAEYYYEGDRKEYYNEFYADYDFAGAGTVCLSAPYDLSNDSVREFFAGQIDGSHAYDSYRQYYGEITIPEYQNFSYYAVNDNGTVATNVENTDEFFATIYDKEYIIIDHDDFDASEMIYNNNLISLPYVNNSVLYAVVNVDAQPGDADEYAHMSRVIASLKEYDFNQCALVAIVSFLLLILLFVYSLVCVGKSCKLDKLFNDIRLAIFAVCEIGLGFCALAVLEGYYSREYGYNSSYSLVNNIIHSDMLTVIGVLVVCLFCFIFYGFVSSVVRQCKNGINPLKNTLVYLVLSKVFGVVKKIIKKSAGVLKDLLSYKIGNFNKLVILWIVVYALVNFAGVLLELFALWGDAWGIVLLVAFVMALANVGCAVFVVFYIHSLDKIITAMHNRTTPDVDYAKLPNSLKILVDSMQYTQDELNKAVNRAVKDERLRTELITNVSHDLKTPLTSIINYVDLLSKCDIEGEQEREYITVLTDKSQKLKRLVDDLVEASKITSGVVAINPVYLNLNELVMQSVVDAQKDFEANNLQLIIKNENDSITAFADGNKSHRIVDNLLTNAKKYSAPHSRVYLDLYYEGDYAVFEIKNISAQPLDISADELTERFVRGDKSRSQDGNGLGLSIAKNLCLAQRGDLKIIIDGDLFKAKVYLPKK